jgi:hypothetical protein
LGAANSKHLKPEDSISAMNRIFEESGNMLAVMFRALLPDQDARHSTRRGSTRKTSRTPVEGVV